MTSTNNPRGIGQEFVSATVHLAGAVEIETGRGPLQGRAHPGAAAWAWSKVARAVSAASATASANAATAARSRK